MQRLLIATLLIFSFCTQVSAEVSNPYFIDEKPKVLFGDSFEIVATSTYHGLENYKYDYVGGFLHITFTYTHAGCCFASYPPSLYITNANPTSTSTLRVSGIYPVYRLNSQPTHLTGLYEHEVQFDENGYWINVVKDNETEVANYHNDITEMSQFEWVALVNNYPRQDPINDYSMSFTPLVVRKMTHSSVATQTPVIIIPGIMSSQLYVNNSLIWPDTSQIVSSISDNFLDALKINDDGETSAQQVVVGNIVKQLNNSDYWDSLISAISIYKYEFPYDWRMDLNKISKNLKEKIEEVKSEQGVNKVNVIAHSMGGLIIKKFINEYGGESIEKLIDIATPHLGSPAAFKTLMFGDDLGVNKFFGLIGINSNRIKSISQNMPSIYQLLPSDKYFDDSDSNYKYYVANLVGGVNKYDFSGTKSYLSSSGRNSTLIEKADIFHREIDNLNPSDYGVETYNIVGCGTPTIGQFYILDDSSSHPIYNIKMIDGDGTVPRKSAEALVASTTYYLRGATHALMPSASGVKELVLALLNASGTPVDITSYSSLTLSSGECSIPNGKIVSFHSPVDLHIYDQSGNHSGPNSDGNIESNIPNVSYEMVGDNKFAFLPDGVDYTIKGDASGVGSFDVRIQEIVSGEVSTTTIFTSLPLTSTTQTQFIVGSSVPQKISIDQEGDGVYENVHNFTVQSSGINDGTGKIIVAPPVTPRGGRSHSLILPSTTENYADPILDTLLAVKVVSPGMPKAQFSRTAPEKKTVVATTSEPINQTYKNSAVVYKSIGERFGGLFRKVWKAVAGWF